MLKLQITLLDQNLEKFNQNLIDLQVVYPKTSFNIFLEENQHIGTQNIFNQKRDLILIMV